jgi:hypothetical protein
VDFALRFNSAIGPFSFMMVSGNFEEREPGESTLFILGETKGELVFVFGFESLFWLLWEFPIFDEGGAG